MPRQTPPVGTLVQYFSSGRITDKPTAGIVVETSDQGMSSICVLPRKGTMSPTVKELVFRHDDPELANRSADWARSYGVWAPVPKDTSLISDADIEAKLQLEREEIEKRNARQPARQPTVSPTKKPQAA